MTDDEAPAAEQSRVEQPIEAAATDTEG